MRGFLTQITVLGSMTVRSPTVNMVPTLTSANTQSSTTPSSRDVDPSCRSGAAEEECPLIRVSSDGLQFIFQKMVVESQFWAINIKRLVPFLLNIHVTCIGIKICP